MNTAWRDRIMMAEKGKWYVRCCFLSETAWPDGFIISALFIGGGMGASATYTTDDADVSM